MLPGFEISIYAGGNPGGEGSGGLGAFSIRFDPPEVSRTRASKSPAQVTSLTATAYPTGGTAPYSYAWTRHSGFGAITATSPAAAATTFSASLEVGQTASATMRVTVTDATRAVAVADIPVTLSLVSSGGIEL